jgi:transcriptional regulator with XRE-family HTH domain
VGVQFRERLQAEFAQRRRRNARYSLRAFARDLGTDHSTLSQLLRGRRAFSPHTVALLGRRLGLSRAAMVDACIEQNAQTILQLVRSASFQPNSRWIATRTGIPVDAVNAALDRLLRQRDLQMQTIHHWKTLS